MGREGIARRVLVVKGRPKGANVDVVFGVRATKFIFPLCYHNVGLVHEYFIFRIYLFI